MAGDHIARYDALKFVAGKSQMWPCCAAARSVCEALHKPNPDNLVWRYDSLQGQGQRPPDQTPYL